MCPRPTRPELHRVSEARSQKPEARVWPSGFRLLSVCKKTALDGIAGKFCVVAEGKELQSNILLVMLDLRLLRRCLARIGIVSSCSSWPAACRRATAHGQARAYQQPAAHAVLPLPVSGGFRGRAGRGLAASRLSPQMFEVCSMNLAWAGQKPWNAIANRFSASLQRSSP
jgi:hypothetical protein